MDIKKSIDDDTENDIKGEAFKDVRTHKEKVKDLEMFINEILPYITMRTIMDNSYKDDNPKNNYYDDNNPEKKYYDLEFIEINTDKLPDSSKKLQDLKDKLPDSSKKLQDLKDKLPEALSDEEMRQTEIEEVKEEIKSKKKLTELLNKEEEIQDSSSRISEAISIRKLSEKISSIMKDPEEAYKNAAQIYGKKAEEYKQKAQPIIDEYKKEYEKIRIQYIQDIHKERNLLKAYYVEEKFLKIQKSNLKSEKRKFVSNHRRNVNKYLMKIKAAGMKNDMQTYHLETAKLNASQEDYSVMLPSYDEDINENEKELKEKRKNIEEVKEYIAVISENANYDIGKKVNKRNDEVAKLEKPKFWEKIVFSKLFKVSILGLFKGYKGLKKLDANIVAKMHEGMEWAKEYKEKLSIESANRKATETQRRADLAKQKAEKLQNRAQEKSGIAVEQQADILDFQKERQRIIEEFNRRLAELEAKEAKLTQGNSQNADKGRKLKESDLAMG